MQSVFASTVLAPELKKIERGLKSASKGLLRIESRSDIPKPPPPPIEGDDDLDILRFPCCNETVKVTRHERHFCIICGTEVDMTVSGAKKVFLSHKGVDKNMVVDFKKTLELLGYDPWLDEDAMSAGSSLERGLLEGMQDSCGVVFFITPSFKDEGYLKAEVEYALQEERQKNERFKIISLLLKSDDGTVGEIPGLLKRFIWKKPSTHLEALREIVRSLPVVPGVVDWRPEITGVAALPKGKSTSAALSYEAICILQAAVAGEGQIVYGRYLGGVSIEAAGKSLIPDQDQRTVSRWVGGLEDLQRRRYIRDLGHKREIFEVTREGYEAADLLDS
jgi:hypothetical protein